MQLKYINNKDIICNFFLYFVLNLDRRVILWDVKVWICYDFTDVSNERTASNFRVEEYGEQANEQE
jgi:hypothetical protein